MPKVRNSWIPSQTVQQPSQNEEVQSQPVTNNTSVFGPAGNNSTVNYQKTEMDGPQPVVPNARKATNVIRLRLPSQAAENAVPTNINDPNIVRTWLSKKKPIPEPPVEEEEEEEDEDEDSDRFDPIRSALGLEAFNGNFF